jgi:hypothetical protein
VEKRIDVMLVGAQKAGTTSLLRYIGEHPECFSHPQKEFAYFMDPVEYEKGYPEALKKYFSEQPVTPHSLLVAKSASLYTSEAAIKRLRDHNPNCKLIFILRNPIDRAYSSYLMEMNAGEAYYDFGKVSDLIKQGSGWEYELLIEYGFYAKHLQTIYKYFSPDQVMVLLFDELKKDAKSICQEVFKQLKITPDFSPQVEVVHNVTRKNRSIGFAVTVNKALHKNSKFRKLLSHLIPSYKAYRFGDFVRKLNKTKEGFQPMDPNARKYLADFFKPYNQQLSQLINRDLSSWDK